ncbi:MAG: hypothetical protein ACRDKT_08915 [Actinomycetota bacterium]
MHKLLSICVTVVMTAGLLAGAATPAAAARLVSSFDTGLPFLVAVGAEGGVGSVWVYASFGDTIREFSPGGLALNQVTRPGPSSNDFDIDIADEAFPLGTGTVAAGDLFVTNGESAQQVFGVNRSGVVTGQLDFPTGTFVGGAYHPSRNSIFLVDYSGDVIIERDPASGTDLNQFPVAPTGTPTFGVFFGDVAVSPITGNLFVVSSDQLFVRELTPTGGFVRDFSVEGLGISGMSGVDIDATTGHAWIVTNQNGMVHEVALEPGPNDRTLCDPGVETCGTSGDDTLSANDGTIEAGPGDDTITGIIDENTSGLTVDAGTGNDQITLEFENASLPITVRVLGGGGADTISIPTDPGALSPNLLAGDGNDVIRVYTPTSSPRVALAQGTTPGRYVIDAGGGNDRVTSGGSSDRIKSAAGRDDVDAGGGSDRIDAGGGADDLEGGAGNDTLGGGAGNDVLHGSDGANIFAAGAGTDTCLSDTRRDKFSGCERVRRNHRRNHQAI